MTVDLSRFPRVPLGHWPTPLDDCARLSAALGPRVLVKRDDVGGLGAGGNKLRKLEYLLGAALDEGADTVVTVGAVQTNHGRQTAAACARLGLRCELVLTRSVPRGGDAYDRSGNIALDHLYGATVHLCADDAEAGETHRRVLESAAAEGRVVADIPLGGSNPVGTLGYVAATVELFAQLDAAGIAADRLVVPAGSMGTAAGVALAVELLGRPVAVRGVCVSRSADQVLAETRDLAGRTAELLGVAAPALDGLTMTDRAVGPGYGVPTEAGWSALRLFARTEGITLDPVYTAKVAAALIADVEAGAVGADETVVFLHTGGLPGLFAYGPELAEEAAR